MKKHPLKSFLAGFYALSLALIPPLLMMTAPALLSGCRTAGVYDPVKTAQVKAALEIPIQSGIRRVLAKSPQHADEIAAYFRQVGRVFCNMQQQGKFDPSFLVEQLNQIVTPKIDDQLIVDVKDAAVGLYKIFYAQRFSAELPPDKWPYQVADLVCTSFNQALIDAGVPGVK